MDYFCDDGGPHGDVKLGEREWSKAFNAMKMLCNVRRVSLGVNREDMEVSEPGSSFSLGAALPVISRLTLLCPQIKVLRQWRLIAGWCEGRWHEWLATGDWWRLVFASYNAYYQYDNATISSCNHGETQTQNQKRLSSKYKVIKQYVN